MINLRQASIFGVGVLSVCFGYLYPRLWIGIVKQRKSKYTS